MSRCIDNYPWISIKGMGSMAAAVFKVGDYKNTTLKDGTQVQFRIIGLNHDKSTSGIVLPTTWEMVQCLPNRYPWNQTDTNEGSWPATYLCHQMNDEDGIIYKLMPDDILEVVEPALKQTADVYNRETPVIIESEHKFWIKSEKEAFGRCFYSAPGEGSWYEWYRQEDVPWYKERNGDREYSMLRSPICHGSGSFCIVYTDGSPHRHNAAYSIGVAPAFAF